MRTNNNTNTHVNPPSNNKTHKQQTNIKEYISHNRNTTYATKAPLSTRHKSKKQNRKAALILSTVHLIHIINQSYVVFLLLSGALKIYSENAKTL